MKRIFYATAIFSLGLFSTSAMAQQCHSGWNSNVSRDNLRMLDYQQIPTVEAYCQALRAANWCGEGCEESAGLRRIFDEVKSERAQNKSTGEEQASASADREAAVRAKISAPGNLKEAVIYYEAAHGGSLASAPKIKPDGRLYYIHGKIDIPDRDGAAGFIASLSSSEENELLANTLRRARGMGNSTDYFGVSLPDEFEDYYFEYAKISDGFDVIGSYVANIAYSTVSGREMQAPVFEAVYFDLWTNRNPQTIALSAYQHGAAISTYEKCVEAAESNGDILACANDELEAQDARLNAAYKAAISSTDDKDALRSAQRLWVKQRDEECALEKYDQLASGMNAMIAATDCLAMVTTVRADELEVMRR